MRERIKKWGFEKKMKVFFSVTIVLVSLFVLLVTTLSSIMNAFENEKASAQKQLDFLCTNYESSLEQYKNMCVAILMDDSVQKYLRGTQKNSVEFLEAGSDARRILVQTYNSNMNINFIALMNDMADSCIYRGESIAYTDYENSWERDWEGSQESSSVAMKISFGRQYYNGKRYTLSIYYPAYSNQILQKSYGLLCINMNDTFFESIFSQDNGAGRKSSEIMLMDLDGVLVAAAETDRIGEKAVYAQQLKGEEGSFVQDGSLISYRRIGAWNYYLLSVCSVLDLYSPGFETAVWVAAFALVLILVCTTIAGRILSRVYAPLDQVVQEMASVSNECLDVRINAEHLGKDFERMADGFNRMMDRLCETIEEVRIKQEQISQTKLNALQSQIHPHFLYNTLDCIHWQAVAEGNREISTLVKALASYYRICLSRGKDIIPLSEELQHIKYYMVIQNMRFDHKIELEIHVDECYKKILLPKVTLQPLVENAVEHGIERNEGGKGKIRIWVEAENEDVLLKISDTGSGITPEKIEQMNRYLHAVETDFGYGVRNVNRRIELLFGEHYGLEYEENENHGVTVTVRLPYTEESAGEKDETV